MYRLAKLAAVAIMAATSVVAFPGQAHAITDWTNVGACTQLQGYGGDTRICLQYSPSNPGAARGVFFNDSRANIANQGRFDPSGGGGTQDCGATTTAAGDRVQCVRTLNGRYRLVLRYYRADINGYDSVATGYRNF